MIQAFVARRKVAIGDTEERIQTSGYRGAGTEKRIQRSGYRLFTYLLL